MPEPRPSPWKQAVLDALVCPKCGASNRPGAHLVTFEQDGRAVCKVCSHDFWAIEQQT